MCGGHIQYFHHQSLFNQFLKIFGNSKVYFIFWSLAWFCRGSLKPFIQCCLLFTIINVLNVQNAKLSVSLNSPSIQLLLKDLYHFRILYLKYISISIVVNALFKKAVKNLCVLRVNDVWYERLGVKRNSELFPIILFRHKTYLCMKFVAFSIHSNGCSRKSQNWTQTCSLEPVLEIHSKSVVWTHI